MARRKRTPDGCLTVGDAAARTGYSAATIYRWMDERRVAGVRRGGSRYVVEDALRSVVQRRRADERTAHLLERLDTLSTRLLNTRLLGGGQ